MAIATNFTGASMPFTNLVQGYHPTTNGGASAYTAPVVFSSTAFSYAYCGQAWWPDYTVASKTIVRILIKWGTVVKSGGSAMLLSLQDVSLAGTFIQPDNVQDQTVAIPNVDIVTNAWYRTAPLSAGRTVNRGDFMAVVLAFDGVGRIAPDNIGWDIRMSSDNPLWHSFSADTQATTNVWSASVGRAVANVVFEFNDGSYGTFGGSGFNYSNIADVTYNSGSSPDEYALDFALGVPITVDGATWCMKSGGDDIDIVLYSGTTVLASATTLGKHCFNTTNRYMAVVAFGSSISLAANTWYKLAIKPTTTTNLVLPYFDVNAIELMDLHFGGRSWRMITRIDGGAWDAPITTRRPFIYPIMSGW